MFIAIAEDAIMAAQQLERVVKSYNPEKMEKMQKFFYLTLLKTKTNVKLFLMMFSLKQV